VASGFPIPAFTHGCFNKISPLTIYSFMFNYLDLPVGVLPVTKVR